MYDLMWPLPRIRIFLTEIQLPINGIPNLVEEEGYEIISVVHHSETCIFLVIPLLFRFTFKRLHTPEIFFLISLEIPWGKVKRCRSGTDPPPMLPYGLTVVIVQEPWASSTGSPFRCTGRASL